MQLSVYKSKIHILIKKRAIIYYCIFTIYYIYYIYYLLLNYLLLYLLLNCRFLCICEKFKDIKIPQNTHKVKIYVTYAKYSTFE